MATEQAFGAAMTRILRFEGGYAKDPADPGGETNFGISKRSYPDVDIASLTPARAIAIYRQDFWHKPRIDQLPDTIAGAVLDVGINMGPKVAVMLLQDALTLAGERVFSDGVIGPQTIGACDRVAPLALIALYRWRVSTHYLDIVDAKPSSRKFLSGWLRRAAALEMYPAVGQEPAIVPANDSAPQSA